MAVIAIGVPVRGCCVDRDRPNCAAAVEQISNLQSVSMTLERLCLPDQNILRLENLDLPCLRELLLQQNAISRIEGLDNCPRLQRLWLWSNKISRIEGLANCGELREVWLQDNKISRIGGLNALVHLQSLGAPPPDTFPSVSWSALELRST